MGFWNLIKVIIVLATLMPAAYADGHPFNAERAKALDDYTNEIAKHPEYTPDQKRNVKKQFLDKAVDRTKKKLLEQARGSGKPLKMPDVEQDAPVSSSGAPMKVSSKTADAAVTSKSKSASAQKRVTSTGAENVVTGGAEAVSFKDSGSAPSSAGGGEVTSGGAEAVQFGGKAQTR